MRSLLSRLAIAAMSFSLLSPITITQATASSSLVTCIKLQSGAERISRSDKCRIGQEAQANWEQAPSDSALSTEPTSKTITICSNKPSSTVSYRIIRSKCARHQVNTLYTRSASLASTPIIASAIARGYNSASLMLTEDQGANLDAPIAFYTVTTSKGESQDIYHWRELSLVINKLNPLTTYTFTVTATTADGRSSSSEASMPVTTPAYVAPSSSSVTVTAVTCANGGTCEVGDRGPGGGLIYYVDNVTGFSCGATYVTTGSPTGGLCHYLEVAPSGWNTGSDPQKTWAMPAYQSIDVSGVSNESSANNSISGVGLGYKNSVAIVSQGNDDTTAAGAARAYEPVV